MKARCEGLKQVPARRINRGANSRSPGGQKAPSSGLVNWEFSGIGFGLAKSGDAVALFPLAAFLENFQALKSFEHIPFPAQSGSRAQTTML